ncbi:MAG TPA: hypothetical protein VMM55_06520 [Thermohalobaculum sp.]|nr:hypothetical protein [Thermohalobaculum sp.]
MTGHQPGSESDRCTQILRRVHLPLENLEFTIDSYIQDNATLLDRQTRTMLIAVRENVHRLAHTSRVLATPSSDAAEAEDADAGDLVSEVLAAGR